MHAGHDQVEAGFSILRLSHEEIRVDPGPFLRGRRLSHVFPQACVTTRFSST